MSTIINAAREATSVVNCFAVHRTPSHVSIRCTKQFAGILRHRTEQRAPGFAGVVLQEIGNGWYELCSRDTLHDRPEVEVDEATAQLFLEYAFIELALLLEGIDDRVVVGHQPVVQGALREVHNLHVHGDLSSNRPPRRFNPQRVNALAQHFGK